MSSGKELRYNQAFCRFLSMGLGLVLTLEFLRAWMVSTPIFFHGYIHIPWEMMILLAFAPFLAAFAGGFLLRGRRFSAYIVLGVAVATRIGLQFVDGGTAQLAVSLLGLVVCLWLLGSLASGRGAAAGVVFGLAADTWLLMALKTEALFFRNGWVAVGGALVFMLAFAVVTVLAIRGQTTAGTGTAGATTGRSEAGFAGWVALAPALVLHLVLGSLPARLEMMSGLGPGLSRLILALSYTVGLALAVYVMTSRPGSRRLTMAVAVGTVILLALTFAGSLTIAPVLRSVAAGLLPIGILVGLGGILRVSPHGRPWAARVGLCTTFLVSVIVILTYYLGFVYRYPAGTEWLLLGVGVAFSGLLVWMAAREWRSCPVPGTAGAADGIPACVPLRVTERSRHLRPTLLGAVLGLGVIAMAATLVNTSAPERLREGEGYPVRVASYNIFMGLGADVRVDLDRLASMIASQNPDVVALQEVSRGWFMSGSVDLLPRLAERLGYSYHFFPAEGETWGNAILTNIESVEFAQGRLPRGNAAMNRGWGGAVLDLGHEQKLLVVVSHLYHPANGGDLRSVQADVLVKRTIELAERVGTITASVIVGDLNAETYATELGVLRENFHSVMGVVGNRLATYPSWDPTQQIDHVFASRELEGSGQTVFGGLASDHLGIAVNLEPVRSAGDDPVMVIVDETVDVGVAPETQVQTDSGS